MARQARVLAGRTVAITGGGRGIGRATAQALAARGMRVAVGDLDVSAAAAAAAELGPAAVGLGVDVTDSASFERFLEEAEEQVGPLDVLVNNAGIMQLGRFIDEDEATARRMVDINLHGVIAGMKLALRRMVPRGSGHIVNISSQAGRYGTPGGATYSATKHAVVGLSEAVRGELRLMKVDVDISYVMPFAVDTELGAGLGKARGMSLLKPTDVAEAIVEALEHRRVEVWVPSSARRQHLIGSLLPRAVSERVIHAIGADRVLAGADQNVRREYELRASRSAPALGDAGQPALGQGERQAAEAEEGTASEAGAGKATGAGERQAAEAGEA